MTIRFLNAFVFFLTSFGLASQGFKTIGDFESFEGYFNFHYDNEKDRILMEVGELETEFLYLNALSSGIGSNDIGLDRGQKGKEKVVYFKKAGNRLLLIQPNLKYRAISDNVLERNSVEQAFAKSLLHGFTIVEEYDGRYLIDISDFLMRDAHGVAKKLKEKEQGSYALDLSKSAWNFERTKAFPKNVEFDVFLTFSGQPEGKWVKDVAPSPHLVTVAQHHSFIQLPPKGYEQRKFDTRGGTYAFEYYDYATPLDEPILKRFVSRHRLKKKDPSLAVSEAVEPIVYYLDNGTPEPVRSALLEGGRWWNQAFEAIGYKDAFQVKILPADVDPMDIRYNVIQWVHRATRGWSYGNRILDPRTGEIIKGLVSLGSLRIRQDFLIAQALMHRPFKDGEERSETMQQMALARIRQLSAHEIGHTLGFLHNFAASTNDRASVMDYPHPYLAFADGNMDFSKAYATGIGDWDKVSVAFAYSDFPEGTDEGKALWAILDSAQKGGLRYLSDKDARPMGSAHQFAHLWDNGMDAAKELDRVLKVRERAIANFSEDNIKVGEPYSVLEDVFVPVYFLHRYQVEAAAKIIGGLDYTYKLKGDGQKSLEHVPRDLQEEALEVLIKTLDATVLAIPEEKLELFPPRSVSYPRTRESFKGKTGVAFDVFGAPETAATLTLRLLLHPERANRMVQQRALDKGQLGFDELVAQLLKATVKSKIVKDYKGEVQKVINWQVVWQLMSLAADKKCYPQVTETILFELMRLRTFLGERDKAVEPYAIALQKAVEGFLANPTGYTSENVAPKIPDGSPIGMDCIPATWIPTLEENQ